MEQNIDTFQKYNGKYIEVEVIGRPLYDEKGNLVRHLYRYHHGECVNVSGDFLTINDAKFGTMEIRKTMINRCWVMTSYQMNKILMRLKNNGEKQMFNDNDKAREKTMTKISESFGETK